MEGMLPGDRVLWRLAVLITCGRSRRLWRTRVERGGHAGYLRFSREAVKTDSCAAWPLDIDMGTGGHGTQFWARRA